MKMVYVREIEREKSISETIISDENKRLSWQQNDWRFIEGFWRGQTFISLTGESMIMYNNKSVIGRGKGEVDK